MYALVERVGQTLATFGLGVLSWQNCKRYLAPAMLVAVTLGIAGYFFLTSYSANRLLGRGLRALANQSIQEALIQAEQLERNGYPCHAAYLQAAISFAEAEESVGRAAQHLRQEERAALGALIADRCQAAASAPAGTSLSGIIGAAVRSRSVAQALAPARHQWEERSREAFARVLWELRRIPEDHELFARGASIAGQAYLRLGQTRRAVEAFRYALNHDPDDPQVHRHLAWIYYELGAMDHAIQHAEEVARLQPEDGRPYYLVALIQKDYHQMGRAIEAFLQALQRQLPDALRAEACRQAAEACFLLGKYDDAQKILESCPPAWRDSPIMLTLRAATIWYADASRLQEAYRLVDEALRTNPYLTSALLLAARMKSDQPGATPEEFREAIAYLERAARADPVDHEIQDRLGHLYRRMGQLQRAQEHFRRRDWLMERKDVLTQLHEKARQNVWDATVRTEIAQVWLELGRTEEAHMWIRAAWQCDPNHPRTRELMTTDRSWLLHTPQLSDRSPP